MAAQKRRVEKRERERKRLADVAQSHEQQVEASAMSAQQAQAELDQERARSDEERLEAQRLREQSERLAAAADERDGIADESDAENDTYRYTTYGREPAVEVVINADAKTGGVSGTTALIDLTGAVSVIPTTTACVGAEEVLN